MLDRARKMVGEQVGVLLGKPVDPNSISNT